MKEKLRRLWQLRSSYDVMAMGNNYFMVKFDLAEDRDKVIEVRLRMVNGSYYFA